MLGNVLFLGVDGAICIKQIDFSNFNQSIYDLIGNGCCTYQALPCTFLNHHFRTSCSPVSGKKGYFLLIDDDGRLKPDNEVNEFASLFYHYDVIMGNAVVVGVEKLDGYDYDFCEIDDKCIEFLQTFLD